MKNWEQHGHGIFGYRYAFKEISHFNHFHIREESVHASYCFLSVREVVITSVLDMDPPCVGVGGGGLCKIPPV